MLAYLRGFTLQLPQATSPVLGGFRGCSFQETAKRALPHDKPFLHIILGAGSAVKPLN